MIQNLTDKELNVSKEGAFEMPESLISEQVKAIMAIDDGLGFPQPISPDEPASTFVPANGNCLAESG